MPIYARSRHRRHTHQLMDLGIKVIRRETFLSSLDLTREVLRGLGLSERDVRFAVDTFMAADRKRLYEDYKHYTDLEKLQARARSHTQELEGIFAQDAAEQAKAGKEQAAILPLAAPASAISILHSVWRIGALNMEALRRDRASRRRSGGR